MQQWIIAASRGIEAQNSNYNHIDRARTPIVRLNAKSVAIYIYFERPSFLSRSKQPGDFFGWMLTQAREKDRQKVCLAKTAKGVARLHEYLELLF